MRDTFTDEYIYITKVEALSTLVISSRYYLEFISASAQPPADEPRDEAEQNGDEQCDERERRHEPPVVHKDTSRAAIVFCAFVVPRGLEKLVLECADEIGVELVQRAFAFDVPGTSTGSSSADETPPAA